MAARQNFSSLYDLSLVVVSIFVGLLAGIIVYDLAQPHRLDGGLGTVIGASIGAGVTVAGSFLVVQYQQRHQKYAYRQFVVKTVGEIARKAIIVSRTVNSEEWQDVIKFGHLIRWNVDALKTSMQFLAANIEFQRFENYEHVRAMWELLETIRNEMFKIDIVLNYLCTPNVSSVNSAKQDIACPAEVMSHEANAFMKLISGSERLVSDEEYERIIQEQVRHYNNLSS